MADTVKFNARLTSFSVQKKAIIAAIGKAEYKVLWRQGANVYDRARRSIKPKGKARPEIVRERYKKEKGYLRAVARQQEEIRLQPGSPPGTPPFTHTGFLPDSIAYAYDSKTHSVVVGTWRAPWLAHLHEHGGEQRRIGYRDRYTGEVIFVREGARVGRRWIRTSQTRIAHYPARPFMSAALKHEIERLPELWQGAITSQGR